MKSLDVAAVLDTEVVLQIDINRLDDEVKLSAQVETPSPLVLVSPIIVGMT